MLFDRRSSKEIFLLLLEQDNLVVLRLSITYFIYLPTRHSLQTTIPFSLITLRYPPLLYIENPRLQFYTSTLSKSSNVKLLLRVVSMITQLPIPQMLVLYMGLFRLPMEYASHVGGRLPISISLLNKAKLNLIPFIISYLLTDLVQSLGVRRSVASRVIFYGYFLWISPLLNMLTGCFCFMAPLHKTDCHIYSFHRNNARVNKYHQLLTPFTGKHHGIACLPVFYLLIT